MSDAAEKKRIRRLRDFGILVTYAERRLLEAVDAMEEAAKAASPGKIPCKIAELVGQTTWRQFLAADTALLRSLERLAEVREKVQTRFDRACAKRAKKAKLLPRAVALPVCTGHPDCAGNPACSCHAGCAHPRPGR